MRRLILSIIAVAWLVAGAAAQTPSINVGSVNLLPDMAQQYWSFYVTGGNAVPGVNFSIRFGDGLNLDGSLDNAPTITGADLGGNALEPTIFYPKWYSQYTTDSGPYYWMESTLTSSGTVPAEGLLARVEFNTAGITTGGEWDLLLWDPGGSPTDFLTTSAYITNGTIRVSPVPEPSTMAMIGMLTTSGMALWWWRRRRAKVSRRSSSRVHSGGPSCRTGHRGTSGFACRRPGQA